MRYLLLLCMSLLLYGGEKLVVIGNQNFPIKRLSKDQIRQIYLKRMRFIKDIPIVPINYTARDPLRKIFEKNLLRISSKKLSRYWMKEHYLGKRPPVVQSSVESAIVFVKKIDGAIAYIPYSKLPVDVRILYILKEKP